MKIRLVLLLFPILLIGSDSGGFDNGTSTGKGKFQLDLTINPFNTFDFGQTYVVFSYGFSNKFDLHGYISQHPDNYKTWYAGIFYQFYNTQKIDLATAFGIRKRVDQDWTHIFFPQLLYTFKLNKKFNLGGSIVNIQDYKIDRRYGVAFDIALNYKLKYQSKIIENITIGLGVFHPAATSSEKYFLPTYSIDFRFK